MKLRVEYSLYTCCIYTSVLGRERKSLTFIEFVENCFHFYFVRLSLCLALIAYKLTPPSRLSFIHFVFSFPPYFFCVYSISIGILFLCFYYFFLLFLLFCSSSFLHYLPLLAVPHCHVSFHCERSSMVTCFNLWIRVCNMILGV